MKKFFYISAAFLILTTVAIAGQMKPFAFPFIGKWQPAENPLLIDEHGFQDIQNMRRDGKRLKGVSGHTKINTAALNATYAYPKHGFHFKKDRPSESHTILYSTDSTGANGRLFVNETAIPSAGNFTTAELHTDATGAGTGRFSYAPQGNMLYCNGAESMVWGGDELPPTSFITSSGAVTYSVDGAQDYTSQVRNTLSLSGETVTLTATAAGDTKLLLHGDGTDASTTFTDSSASNHTVTANGNAHVEVDQYKWGGASADLDGTGDYLSIPDHADWDIFAETDFTIDLWAKHTDHVGDEIYAFHREDADNYWFVAHSHGTGLRLLMRSGGVDKIHVFGGEITDTDWHHVVFEKNGTTYGIYKDGVQVAYGSDADTDTFAGSLYIGQNGTDLAFFDGYLDDIRITHANTFSASPNAGKTDTISVPAKAVSTTTAAVWLVGHTRPLEGIKFYVSSANSESANVTVEEWQGASWVGLTEADGTTGLASTGSVTWNATNNAEIRYIEGLSLYWYQCELDAGSATISQVTVDAPFQNIVNIWDVSEVPVIAAKLYDGTTYQDYTDEVNDVSTVYYADLNGATTAKYLLLGFLDPQQALNLRFDGDNVNADATTLTVSNWDGEAWAACSALSDGTEEGGATFAKSGMVVFQPATAGTEFARNLEDETPLYWYKLSWDATLTAGDIFLYHVTGVPAPKAIKGYKFPGFFQDRAFLFSETAGEKNKAIYSMYNTPDVWNGADSGVLYFGSEQDLTAACTIYNVYQTTGVEQLIVTKANETYRIYGDGPGNWQKQQVSGNIGCVAPLTMAVCEVADISADQRRQVAIWQSSSGVVMFDGAALLPISEDIKCYWDDNDSRRIPAARIDDSVGWYDPNLQSYKLLISSGTGQATHNIELEYSLRYQAWTKLYRVNGSGANPLQCGFQVMDAYGNVYTYGATNEGYVYRLENGLTFDGTGIAQYVQTKDLLLDSQIPLMRDTTIYYTRLLYEQKTGGENVTLTHYCDGSAVATTATNTEQAVPDAWSMAADPMAVTPDCVMGPCLTHSLKISSTVSNVSDGMELLGLGLYYEEYDAIRE